MFNGTTFHSYMYAVLTDSFPSPFTARTMLWTAIRSFAGRLL